jgi:hypothetical protein
MRVSKSVALVSGALLILGASAAQASSLVNGGFESSQLGPWTATGAIVTDIVGSAHATEGSQVLRVSPGGFFFAGSGVLSQTFNLRTASVFEYAFDVGRSEVVCLCNDVVMSFAADIDGILLSNVLPTFDPASGGSSFNTRLLNHYDGALQLSAGAHEFTFSFSRGPSGFGRAPFFVLDGVQGSLAAPSAGGVPEPSTWAIMLAGLGLAGCALRRRPARALA